MQPDSATIMTFTLELGLSSVEIALNRQDPRPLSSQLFSAVKKALAEEVRHHSFFMSYQVRESSMDDAQYAVLAGLQDAQKRVLTGKDGRDFAVIAREGVSRSIDEWLDAPRQKALDEEVWRLLGDDRRVAEDLLEIADEAGFELPPESGGDSLSEWLRHQAEAEIMQADTSTLDDVLAQIKPLRLIYFHGEGRYEDASVSFTTNYANASTVVPDEHFRAFLQLINVSADHYIRAVREVHGINLLDPLACDHADDWQNMAKGIAPADLMRPPVITSHQAVEVVENSYDCCNPILAIDVPVNVLMKMAPSAELLVRGGQVGLHDFVNGAGHLVSPVNPIRVSGDLSAWELERGRIDDIYGLTREAYQGSVRLYEKSPQMSLVATHNESATSDKGPR